MHRYEGRYLAWGTNMDVKGKNKKLKGPILPRNNGQLSILCGPFAGEIMEYDAETGNIFHQNAVFIPNH